MSQSPKDLPDLSPSSLSSSAPLPLSRVFIGTKNKIAVKDELEGFSLQDFAPEAEVEALGLDQNQIESAKKGGVLDYIFLEPKGEEQKLYTLRQAFFKKDLADALSSLLDGRDGGLPIFDWSSQVLDSEQKSSDFEKEVSSYFIQNVFSRSEASVYLVEKAYEDSDLSEVFKVSAAMKSFEYRSVLFQKPCLKIQDSALVMEVENDLDLKRLRPMGGFYGQSQTSEYYFTEEEAVRAQIRQLFSADELKFEYKSLAFKVMPSSLNLSVSYEESFFLNPLKKIEELEKIIPLKIDRHFEVEELKSEKLNLRFSHEENQKVKITFKNGEEKYTEVLKRLLKILLGIRDGMAAYLGEEPSHIAINGPKRFNEIKLLKNSGFFIYILYSIYKKKTLSFEDFWKDIDKIAVPLLALEPGSSSDMEDLISPFLKDKIEELYQELWAESSYTLTLVGEESVMRLEFQETLKNFVEPLMGLLVQNYKSRVFHLEQLKDFEISLSYEGELCLVLEFPLPLEIGMFMETNSCSMEEQKIEKFDASLLKAEISVKDVDPGGKRSDWFDLDPKYFFDGKEISEEEAKKFKKNSLVNYNGKLFYISENQAPVVKWLNYFWNKMGEGVKSSKGKKDTGEPHQYRSHVLDILALRHAGLPVKGDSSWEKIAKEYDSLEDQVVIDGENFDGSLKSFQETGVSWLNQIYRLGLGGILADDMGLGKTVQVLAFLNHLKNSEVKGNHLIVVPTSLVYNWESEIQKFAPHFSVRSFSRFALQELNESRPEILITTYGLMSEYQSFFTEKDWEVIVFDEAQQLKNIKSIRSTVARSLQAKFKICLSGTPMENHYGEYYSLIDLSVPGALGEHKNFMRTYGPRKATTGQITKSEIDYLKLKTKPLVLRRTKSQVLKELPDKTESVIKLNFDEQQKEIYRSVAMLWNTKIQKIVNDQGEAKSQIQMFAALMKLRQICSCPGVIEDANYSKVSPKVSLVVDQVSELLEAGKSVLVFTNFIVTLETIKRELAKREISVHTLTGKDSQKKREQTLVEFNKEGNKVLLMTLKTGGVGLNLTKASYIIHVEPWWNPAAENQGTDRAHRIGQSENVHVYRYIMKNSIEEKIQELKQSKQEAFKALLDGSEDLNENVFSGTGGLSKKDFEYLLS